MTRLTKAYEEFYDTLSALNQHLRVGSPVVG